MLGCFKTSLQWKSLSEGISIMARNRFCLLAAAFLAFASNVVDAQDATVSSWAFMAKQDIEAAHDLIRDNHPGPVDPQNPQFNVWLEEGRKTALEQAGKAQTSSDYFRALSFYINGFADGHLGVFRNDPVARLWPGFFTKTDADGHTLVTVTQRRDVPLGSRIRSCDGTTAGRLIQQHVDPYFTNKDIPHHRIRTSTELFVAEADDRDKLLRHCKLSTASGLRSVALQWQPIKEDDLWKLYSDAQQRFQPELGLRQIDGIWFASLPSFNWWGDQAAKMQGMIDQLNSKRDVLRAAPVVVIDLRGNTGGNSTWGDRVAAALWGEEAADAVKGSFDQTVGWRASALNAELTRKNAERAAASGLADVAKFSNSVADGMDEAVAAGKVYFAQPDPPKSKGLPADYRSPFAGKVYVLTDLRCASACLDFMDIAVRMPGVTHIGLPTFADTIYIDNVGTPLPSGKTSLGYSLKVYRNRVRGNNVWYTPKIQWPGGMMSDEAVVKWVKSL
jgi:hypothetical protein